MSSIPVIEAEVDFHVEDAGKPCKTWYTIFGTFPSPTGVRPLVCLHGGPGVPHNCMRAIHHLSATHNIPVIMAELGGGNLAAEHAVLQPKGLKNLVIADSPASMPQYMEASQKLLNEMPPDIQATLRKHEADGTLDNAEYQQAKMFFFSKHMYPTVNHTMNGPYLFKRTGPRSQWSIVDRIDRIEVPTLLISGKYDGVPASTMQPFFDGIEKAKWVTFAESSHFPHLEEPEEFLKVLGGFLAVN